MKAKIKLSLCCGFIYLFVSCQPATQNVSTKTKETSEIHKLEQTFIKILDSAGVTGSILIFNPKTNTYYSNDFARAGTAFLPASTFKIPNTIVALELGTVKNETTVLKWDGITRNNENWNQDLRLKDAFTYSCVPCYQELARKAGVTNMKEQLDKIQYPGMVFDTLTIDKFWLEGESRISQLEQIAFLQKLKNAELPLKSTTYSAMKNIMLYDQTENYAIYAKTGMAIRDSSTYGWFVGYVEATNNTYFFATNIVPGDGMDIWDTFVSARIDVTIAALQKLKAID